MRNGSGNISGRGRHSSRSLRPPKGISLAWKLSKLRSVPYLVKKIKISHKNPAADNAGCSSATSRDRPDPAIFFLPTGLTERVTFLSLKGAKVGRKCDISSRPLQSTLGGH